MENSKNHTQPPQNQSSFQQIADNIDWEKLQDADDCCLASAILLHCIVAGRTFIYAAGKYQNLQTLSTIIAQSLTGTQTLTPPYSLKTENGGSCHLFVDDSSFTQLRNNPTLTPHNTIIYTDQPPIKRHPIPGAPLYIRTASRHCTHYLNHFGIQQEKNRHP